jgi:hypothetical protein
MSDLGFQIICWIIICLPLHELGHYAAAKLNNWRNIQVKIQKWRGIPLGFAVYAETSIDVNSAYDFFDVYYKVTRFYAFGSLFSILGVWACRIFDVFSSDFVTLGILFFVLYMNWELTSCYHVKKGGGIERRS